MTYTKTILNGVKAWVEGKIKNFLSYKPQTLATDEQEQVRINIGETSETAMELAFEIGLIEPMTDDEGFILTDENDNILSD